MTIAIFFWAFIQNLILGAAIALTRRDGLSYLLAGIFGLTGLNVLSQYYFNYTDVKYQLAEIIWLPDIMDLLVPSLLFLYLAKTLDANWPRRPYLYFLPAGLTCMVLSVYSFTKADYTFFSYIRTPLHQGVLLLVLCWKGAMLYQGGSILLKRREQLLQKRRAHLHWPALLCVFLAVSTLLTAVTYYHITVLVPRHVPEVLEVIRHGIRFCFVCFNSIIVLAVLYYLVVHPKLLSGKPMLAAIPAPELDQHNEDQDRLIHAMEIDRVYLRDDLNERTLAELLDIPAYALSRLLNQVIGKTFTTFVNEYRIREAQRILAADMDKQKTNFAIALESGFRSESVFYVNFKKVTGTTPSKYRKQAKATAANSSVEAA